VKHTSLIVVPLTNSAESHLGSIVGRRPSNRIGTHMVADHISNEMNEPWRQLELMPHSHVSITFRVYLDGPSGYGGYSTEVHAGLDPELVAADARPIVPLLDLEADAVEHLRTVLRYELDRLDPF
jgi:hypothetical protein